QQQVGERGPRIFQVRQSLLGGGQGARRVALFAELQQHAGAGPVVVLNNHQARHAAASAWRGKVSRNVVPAPELARSSRSPPWSRRIFFEMASPRPMPSPTWRVVT